MNALIVDPAAQGQAVADAIRLRLGAEADVAFLRGVPGATVEGEDVVLDAAIHDEESAALLGERLRSSQLAVTFQGVGARVQTTDQDLRIINERHSSVDLSADDVVVFEDYVANDLPLPHRPLKFTVRALNRLAEMAERGRTVQLDHNSALPVGATFAAEVREATVRGIDATWLVMRWYAPLVDVSEERRQRISDVRTGVLRYASIGVKGGEWTFEEVERPDGEMDYFYEVDYVEGAPAPLDLLELSRVNLGAIVGAGDNKLSARLRSEQPNRPPSQRKQPVSSQPSTIYLQL